MRKNQYMLLAVLFLSWQYLSGQETSKVVTRKVEQVFEYNIHNEVFIDAERGDVTIEGWDRPDVGVVLSIRSKNKDVDKARAELDYVKYNLVKNRGNIFLNNKTVIPESEKKAGISGTLVAVWVIHVPANTNMLVYNKFGRVSIRNARGVVSGELNYTDLSLESCKLTMNMNIRIGDFNAEKSELKGKIKTSYANTVLNNISGRLDLNSEFGSCKSIHGDGPLILSIISKATDIAVSNRGCRVFDLSIRGSYCPLSFSGNCYTPNAGLLKSTYRQGTEQQQWSLDYPTGDKLFRLIINASFGSITLL